MCLQKLQPMNCLPDDIGYSKDKHNHQRQIQNPRLKGRGMSYLKGRRGPAAALPGPSARCGWRPRPSRTCKLIGVVRMTVSVWVRFWGNFTELQHFLRGLFWVNFVKSQMSSSLLKNTLPRNNARSWLPFLLWLNFLYAANTQNVRHYDGALAHCPKLLSRGEIDCLFD